MPAHAARDQSLAQNLSKLAGVCGQLKCCLRYELDFYKEAKERFPQIGARISCHGCDTTCRIERNNIFYETVQVRREDGEVRDLSLEELKKRMRSGKV